MNYKIAVISGDGIGPEIVREARKVLDVTGKKYGFSSGCLNLENLRGLVYNKKRKRNKGYRFQRRCDRVCPSGGSIMDLPSVHHQGKISPWRWTFLF